MNSNELGYYYLKNIDEFNGPNGHEKLLIGLKKYITPIQDNNTKIIGIDIGTCVGNYIYNIEELCNENNKQILCFEPNPINITTIKTKIENKKNIKLFECCLSNITKTACFYNWKGFQENYSGNENAGLNSGGNKICDVEIQRLDNILDNEFKNENIIIKFIKIDTEGNDTNIIKGMGSYLSKTKYIIFECSDCLDDFRGPGIKNPMKDIVDFLSNHHFDVYRIGTKKLIKVNDEYWNPIYEDVKVWSDCFAIHKNDTLIHSIIDQQFNYTY
jgi:FkbM family methyltransferase